jgi:putative flippase GtrA
MLYKFLKFGVVGFTGLLIDFSITWFVKERLKINRYIANTLGFITAATSNYFINRLWTFLSHNPQILMEYAAFIFTALIGLVINLTFLYLFENKFSFNFYFSKFLAICVTTCWNFFVNYYFVFSH